MMDRATILAILMTTGGLLWLLSAGRVFLHALAFRVQAGKPYVVGSLQRSLLPILMALLLFLAGGTLGAASWLTRDYQRIDGPTRAARVRVDGEQSLTVELQADLHHPGQPSFASGVNGQTWQVRGLIITFPPWSRILGLGAFHRITGVGTPGDPGGKMPASARPIRQVVAALPAILDVRAEDRVLMGQGPVPLWTTLLVSRDGYVLGHADGGDAIDP